MTVKRRENFQFKIDKTKQRIVKNMSFDEVRNSLVISFAESSITEEEFPILKGRIRIGRIRVQIKAS